MESFPIQQFKGLSDTLSVLSDNAFTALDLDLLTNKGALLGVKTDVSVHTTAGVNSIAMFSQEPINSTASNLYSSGTQIKASWGGSFQACMAYAVLVLVNGTQPIKYDGSNVYNLGITAPDCSSMTATETGVGSLTVSTAWKYRVTFVNSLGFESNADTTNDVSSGAFSSKASCDLASIPTGASAEGIASRKIYRTIDGGSVYYLLTTITNNTATTYVDTTADGSLGSTTYPITHDKPVGTLVLVEWAGDRLFGVSSANRRELLYSLPGSLYEGWPALYYTEFPENIRALKAIGRRLIVFTETRPYAFVMPSADADTFYFLEMDWSMSVLSPGSTVKMLDSIVYRGPRGLYATNGVSTQCLTPDCSLLFDPVSTSSQAGADERSIFYILAYIPFSDEPGTLIKISSTVDTFSFSSETGTIIDIADSDTYSFSAEVGIIIDIESDEADADVIRLDTELSIVSKMSQSYTCLAYDPINNNMYAGRSDGLYRMFQGARKAFTWRSDLSYLGFPRHDKSMDHIDVWINGTVTVNLYTDESITPVWTKSVTSSSMQMSTLYVRTGGQPVRGRRFALEFVGSSEAQVDPPVVMWFFAEGLDVPGRYTGAGQAA